MERSYDAELMFEATKEVNFVERHLIDGWLEDTRNFMYAKGKSVGLATYEYPGMYNIHWFFSEADRGRKALTLARQMIDALFKDSDAKAVRGITKVELKAARWACRQIGLVSYGIMDFPAGPCELFCITKEQFYEGKE